MSVAYDKTVPSARAPSAKPADHAPGAAAERRIALILAAELRNYTHLSEMFEAQRALDLATGFFDLVETAVTASGGETIATHNDLALVAFRRANPLQLALQGVRAAQAIQLAFAELECTWSSELGLKTAVAMGLHLGDVVFGALGPVGRQRPGVFGDTVSLAERLVRRARAGEFVLSDAVMGALTVSNLDLQVEPLPPIDLPRRPQVRIFGVLLDTRLDFT